MGAKSQSSIVRDSLRETSAEMMTKGLFWS